MTPVILLTDGYIANAAEPWKVPDPASYEPFPVTFLAEKNGDGNCCPIARDEKLARPWIKPGTPGLMHRIGGIEKAPGTGHIDYSPGTHQTMTDIRKAKIDGIAQDIPAQDVILGAPGGKLAVVGWGSTFGPIHQAVRRMRRRGYRRQPRPRPPRLAAAGKSGRTAQGLRSRAGARDEHRPVQDRAARPVPGRCQAADQDQRPAVHHRRDPERDRARSSTASPATKAARSMPTRPSCRTRIRPRRRNHAARPAPDARQGQLT